MVTDFSVLNNAVQVTVGGIKTLFFSCPVKISPSADGLQVSVTMENPFPNEPSVYNVLVSDLRISGSGTAPADLPTALSSLSAVFTDAGQTALKIALQAQGTTVANYAAMQAVAAPTTGFKVIQVLSDTVNMGGAEGLYQKWANSSIYQIAANKQ